MRKRSFFNEYQRLTKGQNMAEKDYITEEGLQKLKDELAKMKSIGRREISKQIEEAREKGDLSENAEYDAAKDAQGMLEMAGPFARCVRRAGMDPRKIIPHVMRHTAITRLAETGADIKTIQEYSGHDTVAMVLRYAHAQDRAVDSALDRLEGRTIVEHPRAGKTEKS